MRIIPVLDILGGQVVRGVAGRRSEYRPIVSPLTTSSQPLDVAQAFRRHYGFSTLYVADLDAIAGAAPSWPLYAELRAHGFQLWVDAGVRDRARAIALAERDIEGVIVGLETVSGPALLAELSQALGSERIIFSLDLKGGQPLGELAGWRSREVDAIAAQAIEVGVRRLIVLDLERVGVSAGAGTEQWCRSIARRWPEVELIAGGGVRGPEDLERMRDWGVHAALVASALHDGRISGSARS